MSVSPSVHLVLTLFLFTRVFVNSTVHLRCVSLPFFGLLDRVRSVSSNDRHSQRASFYHNSSYSYMILLHR